MTLDGLSRVDNHVLQVISIPADDVSGLVILSHRRRWIEREECELQVALLV